MKLLKAIAIPSLATTVGEIPAEIAASIACDVILQFLTQHMDNCLKIILADEDPTTMKCYENAALNLKLTDERLIFLRADITAEFSATDTLKYEILVNETTWRLKTSTTPFGRQIEDATGPILFEETKRLFPNPGTVGKAYTVPLPLESPLYKNGGVTHIIHSIPPNVNPARPDPIGLNEAKQLLRQTWQNILSAYWDIVESERESILATPTNSNTIEISRKKLKISTPRAGSWSDALLPYCERPEVFQKEVFEYNDDIVVIWDKYGKARKHLLIMPRRKIDGVNSLTRADIGLLEMLKEHGESVFQKLKLNEPALKIRMGFHAIPSMRQLHMHIISQDFISPALKTKRHWNSFTTKFFLDIDQIISLVMENDGVNFNKTYYEKFLNEPLKCHKCDVDLATMPLLKIHLQKHDQESAFI